MRKDWEYLDSSYCKSGLMICSSCNKSIEGEYRCRDAGEKYITQHRKCCATDPNWATLDQQSQAQKQHRDEFLKAAIAFRDRWDTDALDDLIESLGGED